MTVRFAELFIIVLMGELCSLLLFACFVATETKGFVSRLFKALEDESYKASHEDRDDGTRGGGDDQQQQAYAADGRSDDNSRRRGRTSSEDDDERRRFNKRRRDDEQAARDGPRRDLGRRQPAYAGRGDMRGGRGPHNGIGPGSMMGRGGGADPNFGRRNFPPEWGMPPPQHMGMWQPPHGFPPHGGFPMPDFDPNGFNPENSAMGPPAHMGMMMPRHMGGGQYYPHPAGGRGGPGRGSGRFGGRGGGEYGAGPMGGKDDHEGGENNGYNGGAKTTLRVSNVDPKYVNMTKLSLHFSKFGNVVNVQMRPSFKCAYVQYATEDEAKKAFHSPIPVCNNRFIEVKWAKYDAKDPQGAPSIAEQTAAESSKDGEEASTTGENGDDAGSSAAPPTAEQSAIGGDDGAPEKDMTPEELRAAALEQGRKVLEQKRELLEKQRQLMKQKEELIKRQLAQHKELLERMSQNSDKFSLADKRDLLNKIMALSEDLKALQPRPVAPVVAARADSAPGGDISGLKAELSALEAEASTSGPAPGYGGRGGGGGRWAGGRGYQRGGGRAGGRGGRYPVHSHTLDNRTTIVKVVNLPEAARDSSVLEQHFGNFGAIERVVVDDSASPALGFIKFQDRYGGQAALSHGGVFGDTTLQMAWVEPQEAPAALLQSLDAPAAVVKAGPAGASTSDAPAAVTVKLEATADCHEVSLNLYLSVLVCVWNY